MEQQEIDRLKEDRDKWYGEYTINCQNYLKMAEMLSKLASTLERCGDEESSPLHKIAFFAFAKQIREARDVGR